MPPIQLRCHPQTPTTSVERVMAWVGRYDDVLRATFRVLARTDAVLFPLNAESGRRDELWRHTCFELFLRPVDGTRYVELNLSPSTEWATYDFDGYRDGGRSAAEEPFRIDAHLTSVRFQLSAGIQLWGLSQTNWNANLSAVIEEKDGTKSYWALAHPPEGPPDFHHQDCFVLELPPPEPS